MDSAPPRETGSALFWDRSPPHTPMTKIRSSSNTLAKGFAFSLTALALASTAHAALISTDSFSGYTLGELPSTTSPAVAGYTGNWTDVDFGDAEASVISGSLTYSNPLYLGSSGDRVGVATNTAGGEINAGNSGRVFRLLDSSLAVTAATSGTRYLSFLFQSGQETGASTYQMLDLYDTNTADANRNFTAGLTMNGGNTGTFYNFGVDEAYTSTGVAANTDVHLFVVKFDLSATAASDSVTVWIDPTLGSNDPSFGLTVTGKDISFDRLGFSDYEGNSAAWDEINWGTTFNDVTLAAVPEPSTFAALAGLAVLGAATLRRRRAIS